jgi:glycosyltransferase involved in cell wall biosynthesis
LPKISIVIPSYNAVQFIEETIQSILNQNFPLLECIVIDGGSGDGTPEILKKYEGRLTWISEKDRGQSEAINKGLRLASGDIVAYICADDVYERDCFQKVARFFEENPSVKWAYGKCRIINEKGLEIRRPVTLYKYFWQKRYSYNRLLVSDFIAQPAAFWRRELIDELGLFDVNHHLVMEYEYWLRVGAKYRPGCIDEYLARFRWHPYSKSATGFSRAAREALAVARKYAVAEKRNFLLPLQYLNCFAVVSTYSVLGFLSRMRTHHGGS